MQWVAEMSWDVSEFCIRSEVTSFCREETGLWLEIGGKIFIYICISLESPPNFSFFKLGFGRRSFILLLLWGSEATWMRIILFQTCVQWRSAYTDPYILASVMGDTTLDYSILNGACGTNPETHTILPNLKIFEG